jgi:hypothetical protein
VKEEKPKVVKLPKKREEEPKTLGVNVADVVKSKDKIGKGSKK